MFREFFRNIVDIYYIECSKLWTAPIHVVGQCSSIKGFIGPTIAQLNCKNSKLKRNCVTFGLQIVLTNTILREDLNFLKHLLRDRKITHIINEGVKISHDFTN